MSTTVAPYNHSNAKKMVIYDSLMEFFDIIIEWTTFTFTLKFMVANGIHLSINLRSVLPFKCKYLIAARYSLYTIKIKDID